MATGHTTTSRCIALTTCSSSCPLTLHARCHRLCVPSQWSKGEYAGANNAEDDFAVLQSNGLSLRTDDYGNTLATATPLTGGTASGSVTTFSVRGVIASASDVDVLSIQPAAGPVTITLTGASRSTNL